MFDQAQNGALTLNRYNVKYKKSYEHKIEDQLNTN